MQYPPSPHGGIRRESKPCIPNYPNRTESPTKVQRDPLKQWSIQRTDKTSTYDGLKKPTRTTTPSKPTRSSSPSISSRNPSPSKSRRTSSPSKAPRNSSPSKSPRTSNPSKSLQITKSTPRSAALSGQRQRDYRSSKSSNTRTSKTPISSAITNEAAKVLQRFVRGWLIRLRFKVELLEYKLAHKDEFTRQALKRVEKEMEKKQLQELKKYGDIHRILKENAVTRTKQETTILEGQQIVEYLKKENKKLRDKNAKVYSACVNLKALNDRLEGVSTKAEDYLGALESHLKQIEETHDKLCQVEQKYAFTIKQLVDSSEKHRQFCLGEHRIKMMYGKLIKSVEAMTKERSQDSELVREISRYAKSLKDKDSKLPWPEEEEADDDGSKYLGFIFGRNVALGTQDDDDDDDDSDSENYDEYSVATFD